MYIMGLLPAESAVVFSLSCMHLKCLLGTKHFIELASSPEHTLALLELLALDLPNQVVCSACKRLHDMKNIRRYNSATAHQYSSFRFPKCVSRDRDNETFAVTSLFGATAFKMAIKRYHQQSDCTEILKVMSSKAAKTTEREEYLRQSREECRVIQGSLIQRKQSVYISRISSTATSMNYDTPSAMICGHIRFTPSQHNASSAIKRCHKCRTEYRVDFKYYDGHGLAIFITTWKDLGTGPDTEVWKQHLPSYFLSRLRARILGQLQADVEVWSKDGGPAFAFGNSNHDYRFDELLTVSNKPELFRFQKRSLAKAKHRHYTMTTL